MAANASLTFSGTGTVTGLPAPVNASDAVNKNYVDSIAAGLSWKQAVQAATTGSITLSGEQTIDGFALTAGDRVLVKNQSAGEDNGIYVVASGAWARAADADTFTELNGAAVFVMNGSTNGDTGWVQTAALTSLSTPQVWNQFTGGGALVGGTGISISGATINFNVGNGLEVGANNVIQVNTDATNAVQIVGTEVELVLASGSGLAQSANGLTINAASVTNAMLQNPSLTLDADTGTGTVALGGTLNIIGTSAQGVSTSTANSDVTITVADATTTTKGVASFSANNFSVASGVVTIKDGGVDLASNTVTGTLPVSKGGTGVATFTAGRLLIGDGTNPITTDAELTFDGANNIITVGTATLQGGTTDVTLTATATNGDINLIPNGTGTVNIGSSGAGTIASSSGQTLTVTGDAGLTLGATSNDITMTLANANTAKVTISGPSSNTYAQAMGLNDLVNRDFVENYAVIDGGTY
jgi:hypothetical protein